MTGLFNGKDLSLIILLTILTSVWQTDRWTDGNAIALAS